MQKTGASDWLQDLEQYGVRFLFSNTLKFTEALKESEYAKQLSEFNFHGSDWSLWELPSAKELVFQPRTKPILFIAPKNTKQFIKFSELHYLIKSIKEIPAFYKPDVNEKDALDEICKRPSVFSGAIVLRGSSSAFSSSTICGLPLLRIPAIDFNPADDFDNRAQLLNHHFSKSLLGWFEAELPGGSHEMTAPEDFELSLFSSSHLTVTSDSRQSLIINGGYDRSWQMNGQSTFITSPYFQMGIVALPTKNDLSYERSLPFN
jgi:hypothetical protein